MLSETLRVMGYEVTTADDGQVGVNVYDPLKMDLVITDIIMPNKEGVETIMDLRKRNPFVKIVAMSGGGRASSIDYLSIARRFGAKHVLSKPFAYDELKAILDDLAPIKGAQD